MAAESTTDNLPAARFLLKCGFDLAGLDAQRFSNHDLVKESRDAVLVRGAGLTDTSIGHAIRCATTNG